MFERFTMQARAAVALAAEEARAAGHAAVGTEHVLLGVLHAPESDAGRALSSLGIGLAPARHLVTRTLGSAEPTEGQIPFTSAAQRALELAGPEALDRGRGAIEPEDILLALIAEPGNGASRILLELGGTPEDVRAQLADLVGDPADPHRLDPADAHRPDPSDPHRPDPADPHRLDSWPGLEPAMAEDEFEVGWRGRAIGLAALGAAVLGRSAFDASRTQPLSELDMQLLVYLALGLEADPASQASPGEAVESLPRALACDRQELVLAVNALRREQLVVRPDEVDDERVAITPAGVARVERWLRRVVPLFNGWPHEHPDVDDATG